MGKKENPERQAVYSLFSHYINLWIALHERSRKLKMLQTTPYLFLDLK
jgi:hypothetical protein